MVGHGTKITNLETQVVKSDAQVIEKTEENTKLLQDEANLIDRNSELVKAIQDEKAEHFKTKDELGDSRREGVRLRDENANKGRAMLADCERWVKSKMGG